MGQFIYSPINGIKATLIKTFPSKYNSLPFDYRGTSIPYAQKWQTDETTFLQCLSDWLPTLLIKDRQGYTTHTIIPTTPVSSIIGQTYTCYEFEIDWNVIGVGDCYFEIQYDINSSPAIANYSLTETLTPDFIDGNLMVKDNGTPIPGSPLLSNGSGTYSFPAGHTYSFEGFSVLTSTAANPRIRLTVKKDGIVIYDHSLVQTNASSMVYTGVAKPGAIYTATVTTENTATVVTPISIADGGTVTPNIQVYQSEPMQVAVNWPGTLRFEYTNSANQFSVVFSTGIIFSFRVEGNIEDFTPEFNDVIYADQLQNITKLNAVPFETFMLYVGSTTGFAGIPQWVSKILNWIIACDQIMIDGQNYQNLPNSKWEVARTPPTGTQFVGLKIPIQEVDNRFLLSLKTGTTPPQGFTVVELVNNNLAQSADFTVAGVFKKYSLLKNISVFNYGSAFTLKIGLVANGIEIGSFGITVPVDAKAQNFSVHIPFLSAVTLYVSGLTTSGTANIDVNFDYLQYDQAAVVPGTPTVPTFFPACFIGIWEAVNNTDFNRDWDSTTGLGKIGSNYYGCAICDGRAGSGTTDLGGQIIVGWLSPGSPNYSNPQAVIDYNTFGAAPYNTRTNFAALAGTMRQSLAQIAPHSHPIASTNSSSTNSDSADVVRGAIPGSPNTRGGGGTLGTDNGPGGNAEGGGTQASHDIQTIKFAGGNYDNTGLGAPMDIRNSAIVMLYFKKLV